MKWWQLASAVLLLALNACDSSDRARPIVEIKDPKIDDDICAAVYFYAKTVVALGRGEFRINGHLWRSYTPLVSDDAKLIAEFTPNDFTCREDIVTFTKGKGQGELFYWINLDSQELASKLFTVMDFVEDSGASCWINLPEETIKSSVRVYSHPKSESE